MACGIRVNSPKCFAVLQYMLQGYFTHISKIVAMKLKNPAVLFLPLFTDTSSTFSAVI
jgi:hypothetical protein